MRAVEEGDLPTTADSSDSITTQLAKLWFRLDGLLERFKAHMEIKPERGPPHWESPDLNDMIRQRKPESVQINFGDGRNSGGSKNASWQNLVIGTVGAVLVTMLGWTLSKIDSLTQSVTTLQATQTMGFQGVSQRQGADEQRLDNLERRVYRGNE